MPTEAEHSELPQHPQDAAYEAACDRLQKALQEPACLVVLVGEDAENETMPFEQVTGCLAKRADFVFLNKYFLDLTAFLNAVWTGSGLDPEFERILVRLQQCAANTVLWIDDLAGKDPRCIKELLASSTTQDPGRGAIKLILPDSPGLFDKLLADYNLDSGNILKVILTNLPPRNLHETGSRRSSEMPSPIKGSSEISATENRLFSTPFPPDRTSVQAMDGLANKPSGKEPAPSRKQVPSSAAQSTRHGKKRAAIIAAVVLASIIVSLVAIAPDLNTGIFGSGSRWLKELLFSASNTTESMATATVAAPTKLSSDDSLKGASEPVVNEKSTPSESEPEHSLPQEGTDSARENSEPARSRLDQEPGTRISTEQNMHSKVADIDTPASAAADNQPDVSQAIEIAPLKESSDERQEIAVVIEDGPLETESRPEETRKSMAGIEHDPPGGQAGLPQGEEQNSLPNSKVEIRVLELLRKADAQLARQQLSIPEGNNALETYKEILGLSPDHQPARDGIAKIKETYEKWGGFAELRGDLDKAAEKYRRALQVDPADSNLMEKLKRAEAGRQAENN